jgi:hypothetical protein
MQLPLLLVLLLLLLLLLRLVLQHQEAVRSCSQALPPHPHGVVSLYTALHQVGASQRRAHPTVLEVRHHLWHHSSSSSSRVWYLCCQGSKHNSSSRSKLLGLAVAWALLLLLLLMADMVGHASCPPQLQ